MRTISVSLYQVKELNEKAKQNKLNTKEILIMEDIKKKLLEAVLTDEREYCFDRGYCDDESWKKFNGEETREEAYQQAKDEFTNKSVSEIMEFFGDKYDYLFQNEK